MSCEQIILALSGISNRCSVATASGRIPCTRLANLVPVHHTFTAGQNFVLCVCITMYGDILGWVRLIPSVLGVLFT